MSTSNISVIFNDEISLLFPLVFACFGFLSPANRGSLMSCALILYVFSGVAAGYVSARVYKSFGGENWKTNILLTASLCPGSVLSHSLSI